MHFYKLEVGVVSFWTCRQPANLVSRLRVARRVVRAQLRVVLWGQGHVAKRLLRLLLLLLLLRRAVARGVPECPAVFLGAPRCPAVSRGVLRSGRAQRPAQLSRAATREMVAHSVPRRPTKSLRK